MIPNFNIAIHGLTGGGPDSITLTRPIGDTTTVKMHIHNKINEEDRAYVYLTQLDVSMLSEAVKCAASLSVMMANEFEEANDDDQS